MKRKEVEAILRLWLEEVRHKPDEDEVNRWRRFGSGKCCGCDFEEATLATCKFLGLPTPDEVPNA